MNKYEDIINLKHHVSSKHKQMSLYARAGQFAPFAALTGFSDDIKEKARLTDTKIELTDEEKEMINFKIQNILNIIKKKPLVSITYFVKDINKSGGKYITIEDYIKKIDDIYMFIYLNTLKIDINDIIDINIIEN